MSTTAALAFAAGVAAPFVAEALKRPVPTPGPGVDGGVSEGPGGRSFYRWAGPEGAPVTVCVHGLTTPSCVWRAIAGRLADRGHRVLSHDLYGRGLSDRPAGAQGRAFFLDQLDALLADQGVGRGITLVGYSMGGAIATAFAARDPARLKRLVLLAPAGLDYESGAVLRVSGRLPLAGDWLARAALGAALRKGARALPPEHAGIARCMIDETRRRGFIPAVLSSQRHMLSEDQSVDHRKIAESVLDVTAVWGAQDAVIPLSARDRMGALNPRARHVTIQGAGHGLPFTHPDQVLDAVWPA